jgi:hypothetical protein
MKTKTKWLGAALLALMGVAATKASAGQGTSSYLYIDVTITNTLSVSVNSVGASTQSTTWTGQAALGAAATAAVTNDTGYIAERWELKTTAFSADITNGATGWTIGAAPGVETVEVQAVFVSAAANSCPLTGAAEWSNALIAPALTALQTPYTASLLADTSFSGLNAQPDNTSTNKMNAGSTRGLCWRLGMPTSTALTNTQVVPVTVTAF